ncbi:hypothetical protein Acr_00g0037490 [Actinidia rufa]|uniref:Uncharacterized protein n=1 Tax=Actinidia rufa TaxID=165716 RepID=A0A7J0DGV8_9ERIC|nr:hypothetical protein Acr_00g0037490 [Actinidia rufa]
MVSDYLAASQLGSAKLSPSMYLKPMKFLDLSCLFMASKFYTSMVFGMITKPLVRFLMPPAMHSSSMVSSEPSSPKSFILPLLGSRDDSEADTGSPSIPRPTSLRMLLRTPTNTVHLYWRKFDNAFMRPVFGGRGFVPYIPGSPTERNECPFIESLSKERKLVCSLAFQVLLLLSFDSDCSY